VVEVIGSCGFQPLINTEGLNDPMINANLSDALSVHAESINGGIEGFYPFLGLPVSESAPWAFASGPNPYNLATSPNCETLAASHTATIDTIIRYFAPRACAVFGLSADCALVGTKNLSNEVGLSAAPNPADQDFTLKVDERFVMQTVEMVDLAGRVCARFEGVNAHQFTVRRNTLTPGVYFARVTFREGTATQKVVLR
jgi:hypothetical protein